MALRRKISIDQIISFEFKNYVMDIFIKKYNLIVNIV